MNASASFGNRVRAPYIAAPLSHTTAMHLAALAARTRDGHLPGDRELGGRLLAETYCDLIELGFGDLLRELREKHPSPFFDEADKGMREIQQLARRNLSWLVSLFSMERMAPVVHHFHGLVYELDLHGAPAHYSALSIDTSTALAARRIIDDLKSGRATDATEGVELLIRVIDNMLHPLVLKPKKLMKFNIVIDKTVNGIITMAVALLQRMLRRVPSQVPQESLPLMAAHLERFLILE